ncbi:receptor-type tyrosine-protein phosphatase mu-like [Saccostrea echinata]|uniref:receptor-type tyrosine-protein phosphatase mu-like n=1 Tax=Saccostrea echinata TaxID=191078 RepID=UPI002A812C1C|nr:receptor-type tyrosine-protein phosphatase mu-like [Saccostrea echinata]
MCKECENGYFGLKCEDKCGNCINGTYCDKENGTCLDGCHGHWNGSKCDECENGYYGTKCEDECFNCLKHSCEKVSGQCFGGCKEGWTGARCDAFIISFEPSRGGIVGGLLTAFTVFAFVVTIVILVLRRQIEQRKREDTENVSTAVEYIPKCNPEEKGYVNLGGHLSQASPDIKLQNSLSNGIYYNISQVSTIIYVEELYNTIATKSSEKNRDFQLEYKRLPPADTNKCLTAQKKENVIKNRFKTTFPYEHSRIVLGEKWDEIDNDYINANFIKDYKSKRRYIAAQGPRKNTMADFIKMIWQENIECIIMLTNLVENGKNKCAKYWPNKEKSVNIGQCTLSHLEETAYAFYTVRMFSFQKKDSHDIRIVTQFHYTAWRDHGTPEEIELVQFRRAVTKRYESGSPLLVHCSAGVGRTGTFIALDSLLEQGKEMGRINVFEFVKQMREDRMSMVQTLEQYVFLHKALLCGFQERDTIISEYDLVTKVGFLLNDTAPLNQQQLYKDFKFLETIIPVYEDEYKEEALKTENRSKNVDMDILPGMLQP